MTRYAEAEWRPMAGATSYTGGPKRLVLHTTEGASIAGAEAAYRAKTIAPHFTVDVAVRRWVQHIDTGQAASAMANLSGGVQTNRDGAVQIEVVGFAAYTQDLADDDLRWLGGIIKKICETEGIDYRKHPQFVGTEAGMIATTYAKQRMSYATWEDFDGVCGHQHVPENHHWDPGRFPYDRMLHLLDGIADDQEDEDDMPKVIHYRGPEGNPHAYQLSGIYGKHLSSDGLALCRRAGIPEPGPNDLGGENVPLDAIWQDTAILVDGPCRTTPVDANAALLGLKPGENLLNKINEALASLPAGGGSGPSTAQMQEAVRTVLIEQFGGIFDLPGDN